MIWDFSTLFPNTTQKYKIGEKDKKNNQDTLCSHLIDTSSFWYVNIKHISQSINNLIKLKNLLWQTVCDKQANDLQK